MAKSAETVLRLLAVGAAAGLTLFTMSPGAAVLTIKSTVNTISMSVALLKEQEKQKSIPSTQLEAIKEHVRRLQGNQKALHRQMDKIPKKMAGMATQIDNILEVWQKLKMDMSALQRHIELTAPGKEERLFVKRMELMAHVYVRLSDTLKLYADSV